MSICQYTNKKTVAKNLKHSKMPIIKLQLINFFVDELERENDLLWDMMSEMGLKDGEFYTLQQLYLTPLLAERGVLHDFSNTLPQLLLFSVQPTYPMFQVI